MYYALIVVAVVGVVVYACLKKKKRGDIEKPQDEKPDDNGGHTEITVNVPTESKGYIVEDGIKKEVTIRYMPQGLQVFDENGVCILDLTDKLTRVIDVIPPNTTGEIELKKSKEYIFEKGQKIWMTRIKTVNVGAEGYGHVPYGGFGYDVERAYIEQVSDTKSVLHYPEYHDSYYIVGVV